MKTLKQEIIQELHSIKDLQFWTDIEGSLTLKKVFKSVEEYDRIMNSEWWDGFKKYKNEFQITDNVYVKVIMS